MPYGITGSQCVITPIRERYCTIYCMKYPHRYVALSFVVVISGQILGFLPGERGGISMKRQLSLAGCKLRISPVISLVLEVYINLYSSGLLHWHTHDHPPVSEIPMTIWVKLILLNHYKVHNHSDVLYIQNSKHLFFMSMISFLGQAYLYMQRLVIHDSVTLSYVTHETFEYFLAAKTSEIWLIPCVMLFWEIVFISCLVELPSLIRTNDSPELPAFICTNDSFTITIMNHEVWSDSKISYLKIPEEESWYFTKNFQMNFILVWFTIFRLKIILLYPNKMINPYLLINSFWPSDAIWWQRPGSTLAQVIACCLTEPSHHLNQCWLIISEVLWHWAESNFTASTQALILYNDFENHTFKISFTSPRGQWVKQLVNSFKM